MHIIVEWFYNCCDAVRVPLFWEHGMQDKHMNLISSFLIVWSIGIGWTEVLAQQPNYSTVLSDSGDVVMHRDIRFDYHSAYLQDKCLFILDRLADYLMSHPALVIEVGVHSDERGNDTSSMEYTMPRAKAIVKYLIDKGVGSSQLIPRGYGDRQPVIKHAKTEEEHVLNRRVELKVIKIQK